MIFATLVFAYAAPEARPEVNQAGFPLATLAGVLSVGWLLDYFLSPIYRLIGCMTRMQTDIAALQASLPGVVPIRKLETLPAGGGDEPESG